MPSLLRPGIRQQWVYLLLLEGEEMRDTIDMAREAGIDLYGLGANHERFVGVIKAFEALVRADEREACAEVCKKHADFYAGLEPSPIAQSAWAACVDNRDAIRARSNP